MSNTPSLTTRNPVAWSITLATAVIVAVVAFYLIVAVIIILGAACLVDAGWRVLHSRRA